MSLNRENIIWQSKDGTWNRAFYKFEPVGDTSDPDWDEEWDVEYSDEFDWVSTGHFTEEGAWRSWRGANPGGHTTLEYSRRTAKECAELDEKVWRFNNPLEAVKKDQRALRAKVKKVIVDQGITEGTYVKVYRHPGAHKPTIANWGTGLVHQGALVKQGDWLVIPEGAKQHKVYNTKTGAVDRSVSGISPAVRPTRSRNPYSW